MPRPLPPSPSLEQLRNQAKDLLRECRNQVPEALHRVQEQLPSAARPTFPLTLASAFHVLAREYGFSSWPQLKQHVQTLKNSQARNVALQRQVEMLGSHDWRDILAADAELTRAGKAGMDAVIAGLSHPNARVRRGCAGFMDHQGTTESVAALAQVALQDPVPAVRRAAVHSYGCQRCKPAPVELDLVGLLVQSALQDPSMRVRKEAVSGLGMQPPDDRAIAALQQIQREETDRALLKLAHFALKRQDPDYRKRTDERARVQSIARAQESLSPRGEVREA
jgi:HEAT repeat protein